MYTLLWILMLMACTEATNSAAFQSTKKNYFHSQMKKNQTPLHKVIFTQRGYIQFLRWSMPVPEIQEFTFCVWVKSSNLTYPHSIFSYSKNEKDRLVRAWIAPNGEAVHLEINNIEIFAHPTSIQVDRWYHICQSWDNGQGRYGLWIDGQIELDGYASEMAGHVIPKNGDIVLGQEYTDFDKGLEEGIEGVVFGFNLLLASAFDSSGLGYERNQLADEISGIDYPDVEARGVTTSIGPALFPRLPRSRYARKSVILEEEPLTSHVSKIPRIRKVRQAPISLSSWTRNSPSETTSKPMGLRLIETGYYHCAEGRGSPFIGGSRMLISWTRTPVKIFGGAVLKNIDSQCGVFNAKTVNDYY